MADHTKTTLDIWLPEEWSQLVSITYQNNAVLAPRMDRRWEPELPPKRGDLIRIPGFTESTSSEKRTTFGTGASLTFTATTETSTSLTINQLAYRAFRLPAEMDVQAMPPYIDMLTSDIGKAIAIQIDTELAADNTNGLDALTALGTDNVDVEEDTLFDAEVVLDNANAPMEDRYFVYSPATRVSLQKIEAFRSNLYSGIGNLMAGAAPGKQGHVYSYDLVQSTNLESGTSGKKNALFQKECIALVVQKDVTMVEDMNIEDGLFRQVAGFAVYGFKLVKSGYGREVDGK